MNKNIASIRDLFPILSRKVHGKPLVYFDNAATTLKPYSVIKAVNEYYQNETANIHRGVHYLSEVSTEKYEATRKKLQKFVNAKHEHEIIFTKGTTDSINLVATSFGNKFIKENDEIIISYLEHHSNIVPWQLLCERTKAKLKVIPINDKGEILFEEYKKLLSPKTKLVAIVHASNSLGTINPVEEVIKLAHSVNAKVLVDGAQMLSHQKVDVQALNVDFYVGSAHKMFGPTGAGFLYGKEQILNDMPPYQGGGDMIESVSFAKTTYNILPHKFEAGTPPIASIIGWGSAIDFITELGFETISNQEKSLLDYATNKLSEIDGLKIIGQAKNKASVVSFVIDNIHPHDVGSLCDQDGVALRTGHHCTQPIMDFFQVPATSRASFSVYNTKEEIDILVKSLKRVMEMFV